MKWMHSQLIILTKLWRLAPGGRIEVEVAFVVLAAYLVTNQMFESRSRR